MQEFGKIVLVAGLQLLRQSSIPSRLEMQVLGTPSQSTMLFGTCCEPPRESPLSPQVLSKTQGTAEAQLGSDGFTTLACPVGYELSSRRRSGRSGRRTPAELLLSLWSWLGLGTAEAQLGFDVRCGRYVSGSTVQFMTDGESEYGEADSRTGMEDSIGVDVARQDGEDEHYGDDGDDGNDADHSNGGDGDGEDDGDGDNGAEEDDAAVTVEKRKAKTRNQGPTCED
ncbi:hypothetical protein E4U57_005702 [Claviceps arundinis]|uniref:Uncharacterized protein n=1 Tax=Claviceps arundinis TaxID=1623583 RepID=A0ABQ7P2X5_9HYPO|nr:hypothetical protein E4U57_005702 [Claviceps arundinis]